MKRLPISFLLIFMILGSAHASSSLQKYTVSGYVRDEKTGETLIGATVYLKENSKGTATNQYGFYSITVEAGTYELTSAFLGYSPFSQKIVLDHDVRVNIELKPIAIEVGTVEVSAVKADRNVSDTQMGRNEMDIEQIKSLPAFMGEVDLLKAIQLLPGVQSAGEGNSGYYVRGGGPDQNLVLLDGATVYNASHLFGFFSVFNADAIKNVSLTKGGMPAQYGGRLASVLDISMKEGNNREFHSQGGIGFIASRFTIEGPVKKDTASFIISARRTFVDLFLRKPFVNERSNAAGNSYYFYDLNAKLNYKISDADRLFISGYFGRDKFRFNSRETGFGAEIPWGNATASARWNHLFSDKLFMNTALVYTDYQFEFKAGLQQFDFRLFSGIRDVNARVDFNWFPTIMHNVKFGVDYIRHRFTPSTVQVSSGETQFDLGPEVQLYSHEAALYVQDDWDISDRFSVGAGARLTYFNQVGPFTRYLQNDAFEIVDTITYAKGESVQQYHHLEPRLSARYIINKNSSLKASYTRNYQYIHLASLSSASLPTDVWVPSSSRVKPQLGTQYALGCFRNFKENMWETSVEVYYKQMKNQIEYREGAQPDDDVRNNQDNNFVFGSGWSGGAEFFIKKAKGRMNGWIGYTLSWTERKFADLNNGNAFYAKYDRRHDVSVVWSYELNKRWTFGATWIYATGNALTLPQSRMFLNGPIDLGQLISGQAPVPQIYYEYGDRNSFRQDAYHRLDVSATLKMKNKGRFESSWNFSIFNVYNRYNPYFIYFDDSADPVTGDLKLQAKQVSLFPIIPSITYNFKY